MPDRAHDLAAAREVRDQLALECAQLHPRLNPDLLLTAALVHDLGKTREFTYGAEIGLSEEGRLLGHVVADVMRKHDNVQVAHIANSGWPGRPRAINRRRTEAISKSE